MNQRYSMSSDRASDTSRKKREKRTYVAAESDLDTAFMELDIRKYCPKKIFDIIVINEINAESQEKMNKIIDTSRQYEEASSITFIKYSEVVGILDRFDFSILPDEIRPTVIQVLKETKIYLSHKKLDKIPLTKMALLMKIKLIEVMIRHFKSELDKLETRKILIEELDNLTRDSNRKGAGGGKRGKSNKDITKEFSATEYLETENDVLFDDDIYNHVWFYAFEGFYYTKVLTFLLCGKVPLTAIIKVQAEGKTYAELDSMYSSFWTDLDESLFSHNRSEIFENTMLMQFTIKGEDELEIFHDLLHTIKNISEIKFQHLNYIRHIHIYESDYVVNLVPFHCMHTYNKLVSNIPLELTTDVVVLSSVLEEICFQLDGDNINDTFNIDNLARTSVINSSPDCPNPRLINHFAIHRSESVKNLPTSFICHHRDFLSLVLKMCKPSGKLICDLSFNVLKCMHPFNLLDDTLTGQKEEKTHTHDIDPANKIPSDADNIAIFNHFINLFLFCTFQYNEPVEDQPEKGKFTENLLTYDHIAFCNNLRPKLEDRNIQRSDQYFSTPYNDNPMDFSWSETYSSFILMQEILKTQSKYAYVDTMYCPGTDRMLVQFCDWLDEFGLNTKVYNETLITPVCLRDFCRYTANEIANWIKENPPPKYVRKSEQAETCKGVRKLKQLDMFADYRYLLEGSPEMASVSSNNLYVQTQDANEVTFDEMMSELQTYPPNTKLKDEYSKEEYSKDFLAYDFGTKYFAVKGARTLFVSHDGVKIHVENCKYMDENDKCTVNLQYEGHNLILHSSEHFKVFYAFHWILQDDTIVVFEIQMKSRKPVKVDIESPESDHDNKLKSLFVKNGKSNIDDARKIKVKNQNLETVLKAANQTELSEHASNDIYQDLVKAIKTNRTIYKLNKGDYDTLKVINQVDDIPVATILHRVLHNVEKHSGANVETEKAKLFLPTHTPNVQMSLIETTIFRITLPNGIYVTTYPSLVKESLVEVKQEQISRQIKSIRTEEFRLFTREGYILIKKIDGSITILMSNGNEIDFENPDTDNEDIKRSRLKPAHCKTVNDYRKRLNKLMKNSGKNNDTYYISRRGALETKRGYVTNKHIIKMLKRSNLPYLKTSLLTFDGTKTVLEGNKISQKKLFYTVSENDFCEEEIFYERKDGFKCLLQKSATKTVQYPDGTRITTTVTVANELVDGYVYITLYYKYEHPNYATVAYSDGDLVQVILNSIIIERSKDNLCTFRIDSEATMTVNTEDVVFKKVCSKCQMPFKCSFNISPFHNNYLDFSKQFMHAEDSYKKHFFVDYSGICRVNKNYISGAVNSANCNHVNLNTYKKLYAIKKTMSGEEFLNENMVNTYKDKALQKKNVTVTKKGKIQPVLRLEFQYYQSFNDRLLTNSLINSVITLTKYKETKKNILYYSTMKVLREVVNAKKIKILLFHLREQFEFICVDEETVELVEWLANKKEEETNLRRLQSLHRKEQFMSEEAKYCHCVKDKRTFARKIMQWEQEYKRLKKLVKERNIPLYFDSEYCQLIKQKR